MAHVSTDSVFVRAIQQQRRLRADIITSLADSVRLCIWAQEKAELGVD
jgi:hypothetical protein